jgi:C4-dicarboxylate transporter DctM subunit
MVGTALAFVDDKIAAIGRLPTAIRVGPIGMALSSLLFFVIIAATGIVILCSDLFRALDRIVGVMERAVVGVAFVGMTALAFNEYLQNEVGNALQTDLGGLWAVKGQMNLALLLMVVIGFVGASLATQEGRHLSVDAIDRILNPGPARWVKRFTATIAAGLNFVFMSGALTSMRESCHDSFEGARVLWFMVSPINFVTRLLPGDKYGPGGQYKSMTAWEDAMFDRGLDFDQFPVAYQFVEEGGRIPLWIPLIVLAFSFGVMGLRFAARALKPTVAAQQKSGNFRSADLFFAGILPTALITLGLGIWLGHGALIILASVALVLLGAPLFVGVGVGTLAAWTLIRDGSSATIITDMFEASKKQELLAIPFFVLAGNIMTSGSIARRLIMLVKVAMGGIPGGLGIGAILGCAFFAAISGSSPVTVIAIGSIVYPMLIDEGYDRKYSIGVLTSAGSLGIIIPPSIPMIVYAVIVGGIPSVGAIDPADLFKAGLIPGAFIALVLMAYTLFLMWPRNAQQIATPKPPTDWSAWRRDLLHALRGGFLSLMLPVLILGGIYGLLTLEPFGIPFTIRFTVTEAAAVSVVYALVVELFIHRELKVRDLAKVFTDSSVMMGSLFLILVIAISLNRFFVFEEIPEAATAWMLSHVDSPFTFLLMVNLFLLALGCVMDILSAILIVAPLLAPIAASYGINPIHFGIMFIVNLELGYLTPPMGINLFVASTVFDRPIVEVIKAVVPFLLLMIFCLGVIVYFPSMSLFLLD